MCSANQWAGNKTLKHDWKEGYSGNEKIAKQSVSKDCAEPGAPTLQMM